MIHKIAEDIAGDFSGLVHSRSKEVRQGHLKENFERYPESKKRKEEDLKRLFGRSND